MSSKAAFFIREKVCTFAFLFLGFANCGCVAVSQKKYWAYSQMPIRPDETSSSINIELQKESVMIPLPIVMYEIGSMKYRLAIDFHTPTLEYQRFDSIHYKIQTEMNDVITSGTLPLLSGQVDVFSSPKYSIPMQYIIRCATRPRLRISKLRQALTGSFIIYGLNRNGHLTVHDISLIPLRYYKSNIHSIL